MSQNFDAVILESNTPLSTAHILDIHVPGPMKDNNKDQVAVISIQVNIDQIDPQDFISRVCANMEVVQDKVKLGWKTCDAPKREPANRLETDEDVRKAFMAFIPMLESNRRTKPVYMMIINLVCVARLIPSPC